MGVAFLGGLAVVGIGLLRSPEVGSPRWDNTREPPGSGPSPAVPADNGGPGVAPALPGPRIAIVVDDLGYDPVRDAEWLDLPVPVTVSVLPFGPSSKSIASSARRRGFGVILHVPMEPEGDVSDRTGPYLLRRSMSAQEIADRFSRMAADVPQSAGAGNHMGSAFTSDPAAMAAFAQALKAKGFFFVDSVTSAETVGLSACGEAGVPALRRDVFLDDAGGPDEIRRQWDRAIAVARERGQAVLLCHARRETRTLLLELLPQLRREGIRPVTVEELLSVPPPLPQR